MANLDELLKPAVATVFSTMLKMDAKLVPSVEQELNQKMQVIGSIGLTGKVSAVVFLMMSEGLAHAVTGKLLGLAPHEIDGPELVNDAVGELTNMIVGYTKTRLCDMGMGCAMTPPSVIRGSEMKIAGGSHCVTQKMSFECHKSGISIQVIIRSEPPKS
jgi:chemotaxis protein CheX